MKYATSFAIFLGLCFSANNSFGECPSLAPSAIDATLEAKVSFDSSKKLYVYEYTLRNRPDAKANVARVFLLTEGDAQTISMPNGWKKGFVEKSGPTPSAVRFSTLRKSLAPGSSIQGFKISSANPPGIIPVYSEGSLKVVPPASTVEGDDEAPSDCPGFFQTKTSVFNEMNRTFTTGPVSPSQISLGAVMKLNRANSAQGEDKESIDPEISPMETGSVDILLFDEKDFDLSKIDQATITLGPAGAKPTSTTVLPGEKLAGWKAKPQSKTGKLMQLSFKVSDLKLRCNLDRAIFLFANADNGRKVRAAIPIRPSVCSPSNWQQSKKNTD